MGISYRQIKEKAVNGWTLSTSPGTSCKITRQGTNDAGFNRLIAVTDVMVNSPWEAFDFFILDGTAFNVQLRSVRGTNSVFSPRFVTYPITSFGHSLTVFAESTNGTCDLNVCGFDFPPDSSSSSSSSSYSSSSSSSSSSRSSSSSSRSSSSSSSSSLSSSSSSSQST